PGVACGDVAGAACSTIPGGCSSEQTGACCADDASRADTKPPRPQCPGTNCRYRYQDGQSLRHADLRSCGDAAPSEFRQCLFGRQQNSQGLYPNEGWYVLAEVKDTSANPAASNPYPIHLCKLYRDKCANHPGAISMRLFDLSTDPNETH